MSGYFDLTGIDRISKPVGASRGPQIDMLNDDIRIALVTNGWTPALDTQHFVSDLGANIIMRSGALAGKNVLTGAIWDHTDYVFTGVPTGFNLSYYVYFRHDAATTYAPSDATRELIAMLDAYTTTNLPIPSTTGGNITVSPDNSTWRVMMA